MLEVAVPRRTRSHQIEELARVRLREAFADAGWIVEDLDVDYGEDLLVRIFLNGSATAYAFFVQSKATDHIERYTSKGGQRLRFPLSVDRLAHWHDYWEPVLLTVYDVVQDVTYWETTQTATFAKPPKGTEKSVSIVIPMENRLDSEGLRRIASRTLSRHKRFTIEQHGAEILVERLSEVIGREISYDSQAGILIVEDSDGGASITFFGQMAERVGQFIADTGLSGEEVIKRSVDRFAEIYHAFAGGSKLKIVNAKTGEAVRTFTTMSDLEAYMDRLSELTDHADELPPVDCVGPLLGDQPGRGRRRRSRPS